MSDADTHADPLEREHKSPWQRALRLGLFVGILLVAGLGVGAMVLLTSGAERKAPPPRVETVEVIEVEAGEGRSRIEAAGSVVPARRVQLVPQVQGEVVWTADDLLPGGQFAKGDRLFQIDPRDYRIAVTAEESRLEQAKLELALEEGRQKVAEKEWAVLGDGRSPEEAPLATRTRQLATMRAAVDAAEGAVERARLNLARTTMRAPFDGIVVSENVEVGQLLGPGNPAVTLVGTDAAWVQVSIPVEDLARIAVPGFGSEEGAAATVVQELPDGTRIQRSAQVLRLVGELDPQTRTATIVLRIPDPLGGDGLPLLPGAYVDIDIEGHTLSESFRVPRIALAGDEVWVVDEESTLRRRDVHIAWRGEDEVLVTGGLSSGDRVVVSPITRPIDGAPVRIAGQDAEEAAQR